MRSLSSVNHAGNDAMAAAAALGRFAGDERLAAIFKQMRDIVGVSQSEMARRLGTNVSTLLDFEAGAVSALPDWPETVRIVDRYAELSQVDPSPILSRLLQLQPAPAETNAPRPVVPIKPARAPAFQSLPHAPSADMQTQPVEVPLPLILARQRAAPPPRSELRPAPVERPTTALNTHHTARTARSSAAAMPGAGAPAAWPSSTEAGSHEVGSHEASPYGGSAAGYEDDHAVGFDGRSRARETTVRSARQSAPAGTENPDAVAARRRRRQRRTVAVLSPVIMIALLFGSMLLVPRPFYKVAQSMPTTVAAPLLALLDMAVSQTAAVRDGLRWIELDDPRLRKGDREKR